MTERNDWEQRWHPLRAEWVIIAAHRQDRPWHGESIGGSAPSEAPIPEYAADCYLCPGNSRVSGARNDDYSGIYASIMTTLASTPTLGRNSRTLGDCGGCRRRL